MNRAHPVQPEPLRDRPNRAGRDGTAFRIAAWLRLLIAAFVLLPGPAPSDPADPPGGTTPQYTEEEVKAAILVGFARTTEWPAGTFPEGPRTLVIGLLGRDTLGERARATFQSTAGSSQNVRFTVITDDQSARECHVLFVPRSERRRWREVAESFKKAPVLIIGEADDFLDQGGMVNLVAQNGKMKYEVDLNATKGSSLRIPARVLASALKVRGRYD